MNTCSEPKTFQNIKSFTQKEKLSNSCQSNCHYDNFMVIIQKVVWVVIADNQKVKTDVITGTTPDNLKVVNRWQLDDNTMTTLWHPFVLCVGSIPGMHGTGETQYYLSVLVEIYAIKSWVLFYYMEFNTIATINYVSLWLNKW